MDWVRVRVQNHNSNSNLAKKNYCTVCFVFSARTFFSTVLCFLKCKRENVTAACPFAANPARRTFFSPHWPTPTRNPTHTPSWAMDDEREISLNLNECMNETNKIGNERKTRTASHLLHSFHVTPGTGTTQLHHSVLFCAKKTILSTFAFFSLILIFIVRSTQKFQKFKKSSRSALRACTSKYKQAHVPSPIKITLTNTPNPPIRPSPTPIHFLCKLFIHPPFL